MRYIVELAGRPVLAPNVGLHEIAVITTLVRAVVRNTMLIQLLLKHTNLSAAECCSETAYRPLANHNAQGIFTNFTIERKT